ncbi:hypothetical protein STREPTOSP366_01960 [Streptomyces variabilis]
MRTRPPGHRRVRTLLTALTCAAALALPSGPAATAAPAPVDRTNAAAEDFQQVTLAKGVAETGEPMTLAVLPDRSVLRSQTTLPARALITHPPAVRAS